VIVYKSQQSENSSTSLTLSRDKNSLTYWLDKFIRKVDSQGEEIDQLKQEIKVLMNSSSSNVFEANVNRSVSEDKKACEKFTSFQTSLSSDTTYASITINGSENTNG
jgi:uncharacterized protein (UPF0335 family)